MSKIEPIHRNPEQIAESYINNNEQAVKPHTQPLDAVAPVQASSEAQLLADRREISIGVDAESNTVVTKVIDHHSHEVVYQAPSDRLVQLAREMQHKRKLRNFDQGAKR